MIGLLVKVFLTFIVFYYGYLWGRRDKISLACLRSSSLSNNNRRRLATSGQSSLSASSVAADCPAIYDHCRESPHNFNRMFLHLTPGTIPEDMFPRLHHPGTPAKWSFVMTQEEEWEPANEKPLETHCREVYMTRTGSRQSQPNKCVAVVKVPEGVGSDVHLSHRIGYTALLTNQYRDDYPREAEFNEEAALLPILLKELPALKDEFKRKMGEPIAPDGTRRAVTVMVANEGVMDLVQNFICSAEDSGIDLNSIIIFTGTADDVSLVEAMGVQSIFSAALGGMPKEAAGIYLDNTFSRMMWYKVTSIYLASACGFDALFQDVDLVWMKDPIPYLRGLDADISFMDDGARTPRYTPFFTNSGFYFVKYNPRAVYWQEKMMKCGTSEIGRTHSHQSVLIRYLAEAQHLWGLKVLVLDKDLFPSGEAYHERKPYLNKVIARTYTPYVFHMCWTDNKVNKIVYFKDTKLWYIPNEGHMCNDGKEMKKYVAEMKENGQDLVKNNMRNKCCQRERYWYGDNYKKVAAASEAAAAARKAAVS